MPNWGRFFGGSEYGSKEEADFVNKPEQGIDIDKTPEQKPEKTPKERVDAYKQRYGNYEDKPVDFEKAKTMEWFDRDSDSNVEIPKHLDAVDMQIGIEKIENAQNAEVIKQKAWQVSEPSSQDQGIIDYKRQRDFKKGLETVRGQEAGELDDIDKQNPEISN